MVTAATRRASRAGQGYSLVELLLTVSVLLLFSGLAVVSIHSMSRGSALTEGTVRFETLLRFARAEAAYQGKRVRVEFIQDRLSAGDLTENALSSVQLGWEPDPISEPGVFRTLTTRRWGLDQVNEAVGIREVRLTVPDYRQSRTEELASSPSTEAAPQLSQGGPADVPEDPGLGETPFATPTLTFNPDGSCDSAEIILASRTPEDQRHVIVRLEGFTGMVSHRLPAAGDEPQDLYGSNGTDAPARAEQTISLFSD